MSNLNIIIIIVDSLRKDYAKTLGDILTKAGFISYGCAIAPAPWTIPSHASIFTGLYPLIHGAHETKRKKIPDIYLNHVSELLTLKLKKFGYNNILLTANYFVHPKFGFTGFDQVYYFSPIPEFSLLSKTEKIFLQNIIKEKNNKIQFVKYVISSKRYKLLMKLGIKYSVDKVLPYYLSLFKNWPTEKGITKIIYKLDECLDKSRSNNFIFVNLIEMHEPYFARDDLNVLSEHLKTGILNKNIAIKWKTKYAKESIYVAKKIYTLIKVLKKHKIFDNSLVIVTSDHGQLLGEHGKLGHGNFLYDELLRVPMFIKYPADVQEKAQITSSAKDSFMWISLKNIKHFIQNLVENNLALDELEKRLFNDTVFSESYGIAGKVSWSTEEEKKNIELLEKYRIAVYYKNFKGIFNVSDWKFEEIISYNPKVEITEDIIKHMKNKVFKFINSASLLKFVRTCDSGII